MSEHLEKAKAAAQVAFWRRNPGEAFHDLDDAMTRAVQDAIRSLLEDTDPGDLANYHPAAVIGWRAAFAEIRRRAGLEESR